MIKDACLRRGKGIHELRWSHTPFRVLLEDLESNMETFSDTSLEEEKR